MNARRTLRLFVGVAACTTLACSGSAAERRKEAWQATASWVATVQLAGARYVEDDLTTPFFRSTLTQASTSLRQAQSELRDAGESGAGLGRAEDIGRTIEAMAAAAAAGDRPGVRTRLDALGRIGDRPAR